MLLNYSDGARIETLARGTIRLVVTLPGVDVLKSTLIGNWIHHGALAPEASQVPIRRAVPSRRVRERRIPRLSPTDGAIPRSGSAPHVTRSPARLGPRPV